MAGYDFNDAGDLTGMAYAKADGTVLGTMGYGYDRVGRRIRQAGSWANSLLPSASAGNAFDDNHRQTQYQGQTLSYDDNGNLLADGSRSYVWNGRDQLVAIQQGGQTIASFDYDPLGRRIGKTENGQNVQYLYDGANAVQETRGTRIAGVLTGLGIDERYARADVNGRTYLLTDALGSSKALTNASGAVVQRYDYTAYGQTQATQSGFDNPYQYTGRELDESGLYYYRARYYHPGMARFISEDPIGLAGGINTYAYVNGDPISYLDPLGLWAWGGPLPQGLVDGAAGFGDGVSNVLTFGLYSTRDFRGDTGIDGGVNSCSCAYRGAKIGGAALGIAIYARAGVPGQLTHFTSPAGAAGIAATGMRAGGGLFGRGVYATTIGRPWNLFVPAGSSVPLGISGEGFMRILPGLVYLRGGSPVTAAWYAGGGSLAAGLWSDEGCN